MSDVIPTVYDAVKGGIPGGTVIEPGSLVRIVSSAPTADHRRAESWALWSQRCPSRLSGMVGEDQSLLVVAVVTKGDNEISAFVVGTSHPSGSAEAKALSCTHVVAPSARSGWLRVAIAGIKPRGRPFGDGGRLVPA